MNIFIYVPAICLGRHILTIQTNRSKGFVFQCQMRSGDFDLTGDGEAESQMVFGLLFLKKIGLHDFLTAYRNS